MDLERFFREDRYRGVSEEYFNAVVAAKANGIDKRFLNDSLSHAKLLADLMIGEANTEDDVRIYSGSLSRDCYDEALRSSKAKSVHVLVDADKAEAAKANYDRIGVAGNPKIKVRVYDQKAHYSHFFVSGHSFRLELSDKDATAVANFNDQSEVLGKLSGTFDAMWNKSKPLNEWIEQRAS